jgi:hypothetical protein
MLTTPETTHGERLPLSKPGLLIKFDGVLPETVILAVALWVA